MSGVASSLDGSVGHKSESVGIPMSTADKLHNLARYKLLPLKQKEVVHKLKTYLYALLPPLNQKVLRLRELPREFMLLRDLLLDQELMKLPFIPPFLPSSKSSRLLTTTPSLSHFQPFYGSYRQLAIAPPLSPFLSISGS